MKLKPFFDGVVIFWAILDHPDEILFTSNPFFIPRKAMQELAEEIKLEKSYLRLWHFLVLKVRASINFL